VARIGVLGPGGVGGLLAARLGAAGHEVTVVATERTAAELTARGLAFTGPDGATVTSRPEARPWLAGPVDVLFVTTKATELLPALDRVPAALLGPATVVPLLNGTDHPALLRALYPAATVVAASIAVEATRHRPGVVEQLSTLCDLVFSTATPAGGAVAELATAAGLKVATAPDDATVLWRKLSFLAPMALLATARNAPLGPAREARPDWLRSLVDEATSAAAASGVPVPADRVLTALQALPGTMKPSLLKDFQAGNALELDAIAGPIIRALGPEKAPTTVEVARTILDAR
jgi:2-dehydropantoate 2-reductase